MLKRTGIAAALVALLAAGVAAQEQRGAIEGIVRDASGAVLPGVTVEATGATGTTVVVTTDETGTYRFPALAPGLYTVNANLTGFTPRTVENVDVRLGQIKKVDFALAVGGVSETVQVTGESPLIDIRQAERATHYSAELIDRLPKGRDFSTVVTQSPGANNETRLGGCRSTGRRPGKTGTSSTAPRRPTCAWASRARSWSSTSSRKCR